MTRVSQPAAESPSWDWQGPLSLHQFRRNCEALRPRAAELVQRLEDCPFPGSPSADALSSHMAEQAAHISAAQSRDGNWVLYFQGKPLYSRYRPLEECRKWIEKDLRKETNAAIFAGFGLGYQLEELLSHRSKALILLVEPSYALFKAALCLRELSTLLSNPQFFCSVGPAANLERYLHHFSERSFQFYQLQALYNSQHSFYQPLQRRILSLLSRFRINTNTLNRFGQLWVKNICMNLRYVARANDAAIFYRRFQGLPFLLIAAGPSLHNLLPALPQLRERFVLLAVDTALGPLLRQGIRPDFVVSVDPQLLNARHYDFCESPSSILVSESCIYPAIFQRKWRFRALFHSHFPLMERIEQQLVGTEGAERGSFGRVRSGGSVATAAWDFARNCRASALYAVGLDLSYPTLNSHAPGTLAERQSLRHSSRLKPVEQINWRVTVSAGARQVDSWQNTEHKVLSDKRMNVYRNWLEESLKNLSRSSRPPNTQPQNPAAQSGGPAVRWPNFVIDACGGRSAKIEGMQRIELKDALREPKCRAHIQERLNSILQAAATTDGGGKLRKQSQGQSEEKIQAGRREAPHYRGALLKALEQLLGELRDIYRWSAELLALLCYNRRNDKQEKRLQQLQVQISQSPGRNIVSFFFTDTLSQMVGRSPEQQQEGQQKREHLLIYQHFYLSSKFHIYWLETAQRQLREWP